MEEMKCVEQNCKLYVEYVCQCISPETYFCEKHFISHCKVSRIAHTFDPVFMQPFEGTKEAILNVLAEEMAKQDNSRRKILDSFSQNLSNSETSLEDLLKKIDSDSAEIKNHFERVSKVQNISKLEKDPVLKLLALPPSEAAEKFRAMIPIIMQSPSKVNTFCGWNGEIEKMIENSIKKYFETFLESRLLKIEKSIDEHDRQVSVNNMMASCQLKEVKDSISDLVGSVSNSIKEFVDWKKVLELKNKNDQILLNSQYLNNIEDISEIGNLKNLEDLNKKLSNTNEKLLNVENLLIDYKINELNAKKLEILSRVNDSEIERKFRETCSLYENDLKVNFSESPALAQAYKEYIDAYRRKTSLYTIRKVGQKIYLVVYDSESEKEELKELDTPEILSWDTCMAQLPNGDLFLFGNFPVSGLSLIVDSNYGVRILPSGKQCQNSSAIYFNKNIYCFGGSINLNCLTLAERYDLDSNQWHELTPLPKDDCYCHSVIFNNEILISGQFNKNILRYAIDRNSYTAIPFEFGADKKKILISAERLYLIECTGSIYESEIGNCDAWKKLLDSSSISYNELYQIYTIYNKGSAYIATTLRNDKYFKFNLDQKVLNRIWTI